jgi:hypothetical protein
LTPGRRGKISGKSMGIAAAFDLLGWTILEMSADQARPLLLKNGESRQFCFAEAMRNRRKHQKKRPAVFAGFGKP